MKKHWTYKNIEAFVFRLWEREVSEDQISEKEMELLKEWKHHAEKDLDTRHIRESKERILFGLEHYFSSPDIGSAKRVRKHTYKIAAAIILFLSLGSFFTYTIFFKPDVYFAESASRIVHLKDGSVVTLLPGGELTVAKSFPASTRVVDLKGDAVFSVAKSKEHPFIVHADGFSTRVLGTVFKISQSGKKKSVDLYEGKVAVSSPGVPVSYLKPHQEWTNFGIARTTAVISFTPGKTSVKDVPSVLSLSFNDVPLKEVVAVLESSYNTKVYYPKESEDKKITADFTGGTVGENIESLAFILGLEVQKKENTYTLKK
ncbi:FecR family protein [Chryseobacterium sp. Tr-659]|uniref:FecR family protein n=1 Tax=Chryseobacterium sp. Tr-659 TaxID=2608340 RepID=UPI001E4F88B2|nr:FecR family protein [Chryseobacterium sp. Tr-659]